MGVMVMDTSTDTLGVAIGQADGTLQSAVVQRILRGHSRLLQPSIQFVMQSAGASMADVERVGVGIGPGSYTGVRMGVATGKAIAHALSVPLVTIPTLDALALAATQARGLKCPASVLVLLFARRHRAYGAWFTAGGGQLFHRSDAVVRDIDEWLSFEDRPSDTTGTLVLHDFPAAQGEAFRGLTEEVEVIHWADACSGLPHALLRLAVSGKYPAFAGEALHAVEPDYALPVEAEKNLLAKQEGGAHHDRV